ncbi:hypothetical protein Q3H58_002961 [Pseudomonas psychrotolerans]|nr:hypothetical protein [Pseudomonas psychrotolerans]
MHLGVVATVMDDALVIAQADAVLAEQRLQPAPGHRPRPAQVVAPVAAGVARQRLVLEATDRGQAAQAHPLRAVEHVIGVLAGRQAAETEIFAEQLEVLQVAQGPRVLAVAGGGLAGAGDGIALGAEDPDAALPAQIQVDEGAAEAATVVEAQLQLADAVAAQPKATVLDVVIGAQQRQPRVERRLAHRVAMHHPLGLELLVLAVAALLEGEAVGLGLGAVVVAAVAVVEGPPAPRQAVTQVAVA